VVIESGDPGLHRKKVTDAVLLAPARIFAPSSTAL